MNRCVVQRGWVFSMAAGIGLMGLPLLVAAAIASDKGLQSVLPCVQQGVHPNLILSVEDSGVMTNAHLPSDLSGGHPDPHLNRVWVELRLDDDGSQHLPPCGLQCRMAIPISRSRNPSPLSAW